MRNGHISSPYVSHVRRWLSNASGTSRRKMPSDRQIYFLWAALSTLIAQSAYHPQIETCPSADFKAYSVESYLYTPNTVHWQYYQPCCMMNDITRSKCLLIGRVPLNINQSLFTSIKPKVHWQSRLQMRTCLSQTVLSLSHNTRQGGLVTPSV